MVAINSEENYEYDRVNFELQAVFAVKELLSVDSYELPAQTEEVVNPSLSVQY